MNMAVICAVCKGNLYTSVADWIGYEGKVLFVAPCRSCIEKSKEEGIEESEESNLDKENYS